MYKRQHVDIRPIADTSREDRVWGRYRLFADQDQHDEFDNKVVEIAHGDWQNWCYKRFVVCKELMHTFDGISARVSGQEGFDLLADEIEADQEPETRPRQRSPQLQSEIDAQWKALLLVVPVVQRNEIAKAHPPIDPDYIAKTYRIPRVLVRALLSQDYEDAAEDFLNSK